MKTHTQRSEAFRPTNRLSLSSLQSYNTRVPQNYNASRRDENVEKEYRYPTPSCYILNPSNNSHYDHVHASHANHAPTTLQVPFHCSLTHIQAKTNTSQVMKARKKNKTSFATLIMSKKNSKPHSCVYIYNIHIERETRHETIQRHKSS